MIIQKSRSAIKNCLFLDRFIYDKTNSLTMIKRKEIARSGLILANVGIALAGLGYFVAIVLGLAAFVTF